MEDDELAARIAAAKPGTLKIKIVSPPNEGKPYTDAELETLLLTVPTEANIARLARAFGRTRGALSMLYKLSYSGEWFKKTLKDKTSPLGNNVHQRLAEVKERLKIVVGYQPKPRSLTIGGPVGY